MYRFVSFLGLAIATLILAFVATLISFRIATDEGWNVQKVASLIFLGITLIVTVAVYVARKREFASRPH